MTHDIARIVFSIVMLSIAHGLCWSFLKDLKLGPWRFIRLSLFIPGMPFLLLAYYLIIRLFLIGFKDTWRES